MPAHRSRGICAALLVCALWFLAPHRAAAAQQNDPVTRALADGDVYESKRNYQLALDSYRKADKLSHHSSSQALFKIALIEKKAGMLSDAANDARKAIACAQGDKTAEVKARLLRATLLTEMAGKPTDNKLKDAEAELRGAIALEPNLPVAHLNLAMVLFKQERDAEGIAEMKALLAIPSTDPEMAAEANRIVANPIRARAPFAPDFAFHSHDNQDISNASLRGKVALIDFWGTWCPPCRESVPILKDLQKKYNGKLFQLVSISSDDDEDVWKTFIAAQRMDWAEYLDSSGVLQNAFKIDSFPTYIVVDKDGVIRFRQAGLSSMTEGELEKAIGKALKNPSNPALAKAAAAGDTTVEEGEEKNESDGGPKAKPEKALASDSVAVVGTTPAEPAATAFEPPEGGHVSGNVYSNRALGLRFEFPSGWIATKPEALRC